MFQHQQPLPTLATNQYRAQIQQAKSKISCFNFSRNFQLCAPNQYTEFRFRYLGQKRKQYKYEPHVVRDQLFQLQQPLPALATTQYRAQNQQAKSNVSAGHVERSYV